MADSVPLAVRVRFGIVCQVRLIAVPHKEQVAQHSYLVPLLSISQQLTYRNIQMFSQQIQTGRLNGCDNMNSGPQVKGLISSHVLLAF